MGTSYSALAFFGTYAPQRTPAANRLAHYIEHGSPTRTKLNPVIMIDVVGNAPMGDEWIVIRVEACLHSSTSRAPVLLSPMPGTMAAIEDVLRSEGINPDELPPIGWHFATRVL